MKVIDAANLVVWVDDSQIVRADLSKTYGDKPGLWLRVWPLTKTPTEGVFA
jgi:Holliday junction resolvase RusA-like endonuclease